MALSSTLQVISTALIPVQHTDTLVEMKYTRVRTPRRCEISSAFNRR